MRGRTWIALTLPWLLLAVLLGAVAAGEAGIVVTIDSDGVVYVEMSAEVTPRLNSFECPVKPMPATIVATVDGRTVPPIYHENMVVVPSNTSGVAIIKYVANTTLAGGKLAFNFTSTALAKLRVMQGVVLLSLPEEIVKTELKDDVLVITFRGPATIAFTPTQVSEEAPPPPPSPKQAFEIPWWVIAGAVAVIAVVGAAVAIAKGRAPTKALKAGEMDDVDRAILKRLEEGGGEVLQSELYRDLNLPKTTIWRHVKRLEKMGFVTVERVGTVNKVRLLRKS
ncbi:MAG: winged helix-turn-helix transcriptional regulator [Candidatus Verstraetearchaeota archaeon]|nr:winged helix-turn-helix transcriptional regulator [Candidatus Verstraetearchaeota archaeon]